MISLGLLRRKPENPLWRLTYVAINPAWADAVREDDRVFVLRRGDELFRSDGSDDDWLPEGLDATI